MVRLLQHLGNSSFSDGSKLRTANLHCLFLAKQCVHNGKLYQHGDTFPDDCNRCRCVNGGVRCTKKLCPKNGKLAELM